MIYIAAFVLLCIALKRFCLLVWETKLSNNAKNLTKYREIEDKIFME